MSLNEMVSISYVVNFWHDEQRIVVADIDWNFNFDWSLIQNFIESNTLNVMKPVQLSV